VEKEARSNEENEEGEEGEKEAERFYENRLIEDVEQIEMLIT